MIGGRPSISAAALAVLALGAPGCGDGSGPDAAAGRAGGAAESLDAAEADTQFVRDSLGNEIMIVSKRTAHLLPREIRPRAGAGDISSPDAWRVIDARTAHSLMQAAQPPWYVIDVRGSREYASGGHIAGAALVPLEQLPPNVEDLHVRSDQVVFLYADDELRATEAARMLAGYGFPHLRVLGGGLASWKEAGLPVEER